MFRTLRFRLTIWFILLSLLVYASVATLGMLFFQAVLTSSLDDELQELSRELLPTVVSDKTYGLELSTWPIQTHKHNPIKMLAAVQLFDAKGALVQEYGTKGFDQLLHGTVEVSGSEYAKRSYTTPVYGADSRLVGYLQIQLTTKLRDHSMHQFALTAVVIAPVLLLALGICGYVFAGQATQPIEETFLVLKQFISDAGHELQTPLAIISAATENMAVALEDTPHAQRIGIISRNTDRMSRLVRDLMLLTKVDARAQTKPSTSVQMDRLVKQCVEEFADRFAEKKIQLVSAAIDSATVMGDQDALHRLVTNLIENALRYTNEGGSVTVSLRVSGRAVRVTVEDTGIGIPPDSLPHLFDRFYRVDKSRSRDQGGFGLGLAIVKAIADGHRGYVEVASELGKGTRFSVVMPMLTA
jgi:signal transduction histidine kinase